MPKSPYSYSGLPVAPAAQTVRTQRCGDADDVDTAFVGDHDTPENAGTIYTEQGQVLLALNRFKPFCT